MDNFIRRKKVLAKKLQKNGFFGVFTHYCTESLRNFTVVLRWCSNLQDSRLFDWARCASNKMDNFIRRNKKFWAKKLQKNGFFGVFTHYCTQSLRNFTVVLRWCSNLQDGRLFDLARCASNKMDNFMRRKISSGPKNFKKMGFLGFSHITVLNRFGILVYCSDDAQAYRMFAYLIGQGAPVIKWTTVLEEKKFWAKKLQKNGFFGVFTHYCTESLRNFTLALRWFSNLQDSRPFEFESCASYKKGNFIRKKIRFGRENFKNWVFWGFSHITALNRFAILLRCCDDDQAFRIVAYLIEQGAPVIKWTTLSEEK